MRICDYKFAVYGFFAEHREGARDRKAAVRCRERLGGLLKYYEREAA
jgi:hypothetical protein